MVKEKEKMSVLMGWFKQSGSLETESVPFCQVKDLSDEIKELSIDSLHKTWNERIIFSYLDKSFAVEGVPAEDYIDIIRKVVYDRVEDKGTKLDHADIHSIENMISLFAPKTLLDFKILKRFSEHRSGTDLLNLFESIRHLLLSHTMNAFNRGLKSERYDVWGNLRKIYFDSLVGNEKNAAVLSMPTEILIELYYSPASVDEPLIA